MSNKVDGDYCAGQLWHYKTRKGEEQTKLLILKTELLEGQNIVHATVVGNHFNGPSHMPFEKSAIDKSITSLCDQHYPIPDFQEGYHYWKAYFDKGEAGIYGVTVAEALNL